MKKFRLLTLTLTLALMASVASAGMLEVGSKAPDFTLTDHLGNQHSLSDYEGKIVVLEWVNPDCPFVKRHYEAGTMTTTSSKFADKEVVWLAVNSTKYFTQETNAEFSQKHELAYPVLDDHSGDVGRLYHAKTTPQMFVIDAKGTLVYNGAIDDDPRGQNEDSQNYVTAALKGVISGHKIEQATTKPYGCSVKYAEPDDAKVKATS